MQSVPHVAPGAAMSPEEALLKVKKENEGTVVMMFPKDVLLTLSDFRKIHFKQGVHEVPASLADHDWLLRNKVKVFKPEPGVRQITDWALTDKHIQFMRHQGFTINSLKEATEHFNRMTPGAQLQFVSDAATWKQLDDKSLAPKSETKKLAPKIVAIMTEKHAAFLRSRGYEAKDAAGAQKFFDNQPDGDMQQGFLDDTAAWVEPKVGNGGGKTATQR